VAREQRRSSAAASDDQRTESNEAFARARAAATKRMLVRPLREPVTREALNRSSRETIEIAEMFQRVQRDAAKNARGWTWNLLHVLDWTGHNVEVNERAFRGSLSKLRPKTSLQIAAECREQDEARKARGRRLLTLRDAFAAAAADMRWGFLQNVCDELHEAASGELNDHMDTFARLIGSALAAHEQLERGIAQIDELHGRNRRVEHVKAAALVALAELHLLAGSDWKARVADLVDSRNYVDPNDVEPNVPPCPGFAAKAKDGVTHATVRKLLNRCSL
jgi:hypothetical protein